MKTEPKPSKYSHGQLVEVLSESQILATLDADGKLEGVPFMPEMIACCGRRFRVYRRADKTCVEGYGVRQMTSTVFLEDVRCDGSAHDGCQRGCLVFWKEAWLKPADGPWAPAGNHDCSSDHVLIDSGLLRTRVGDRYFCQSTELATATKPLSRWNIAHWFRDLRQGELPPGRFLRIVSIMALNRLRTLFGFRKIGALAGSQTRTNRGELYLQLGDAVEVKRPAEIEATLDAQGKNRGLAFDPEMIDYCGGRYEVDFPVEKIILEESGRMIQLENTVALKGVTCQGLCAKNCPRSNPIYWRESWLERVETPQPAQLQPSYID